MLRDFYPEIEPHTTGMLDVGDGHSLFFSESGNKKGIPVVCLHGGPGGSSKPKQARFFNPKKYRIILFDQRGCGKSTPRACIRDNTTVHLVADIEKLRTHLNIDQWIVFGGSWGSTLAMAYVTAHAKNVLATVMFGIFLGRTSEADALVRQGGVAAQLYPDAHAQFLSLLTKAEQKNPLKSYAQIIIQPKNARRSKAMRAWCKWESILYTMGSQTEAQIDAYLDEMEPTYGLHTAALFETSYISRKCYLDADALLKKLKKLGHIPAFIFQGRLDLVCPPQTAWDVHQAWTGSQLTFIEGEGHTNDTPKMLDALIRTTDDLAKRFK